MPEARAAAIVTGASGGIGRAVALGLADRGFNVAISYHHAHDGAVETAAAIERRGVEALIVRADVSVDADCRALVETTVARWPTLHVLVNNAAARGVVPHAELDLLTDEVWDAAFRVNVRGAFAMARAAAGTLRSSGRGAIVNVSSVGGAGSSSVAYSASKAALDDLTRSLARVLAPEVRVNAVAPGFITTDRTRERFGARFEAVQKLAQRQTLLDREGSAEHVAQVVLSLVTGMDWVTGQVLVADGGASVRR